MTHGFVLSGSFCWGYFAKIERKFSRNRPNSFPEMFANYFFFRFDRFYEKKLLLESSSFVKDWQNIVTWGNTIPSRRFFRRICGFSAILNVFAILWGVCKFLCKIFCKFFRNKINKKKCFCNLFGIVLYCNFILQSSHVIVEQFWKFLRPLRYIFSKGLWN